MFYVPDLCKESSEVCSSFHLQYHQGGRQTGGNFTIYIHISNNGSVEK